MTALAFAGESPQGQVVAQLNPGNDVVGFVRNLPACYQLLPPPAELYRGHRPYPLNWDPYDATAWGLEGIRQDYLDDARQLYERLAATDVQVEVVQITGCHRPTVTDVWRAEDDSAGQPSFTRTTVDSGPDSGDGMVPLYSTCVEGLPAYYVEEAHPQLPANAAVIDAVLALVQGGEPSLPRELPEPTGLRSRFASVPLVQQVAEIRHRIESGEFRREDLFKIFFAE